MNKITACLLLCLLAPITGHANEINRDALIAAARNLTLHMWIGDMDMIRQVVYGSQCGIIQDFTAQHIVRIIANDMDTEKTMNGLIDDPTLDPLGRAQAAVNQALGDAREPSFCRKFLADPSRTARALSIVRMAQQ